VLALYFEAAGIVTNFHPPRSSVLVES